MGWIDDYETMLSRAGMDATNLVSLKSKVKILMPFFIDHNRKLIEDYIENCIVDCSSCKARAVCNIEEEVTEEIKEYCKGRGPDTMK